MLEPVSAYETVTASSYVNVYFMEPCGGNSVYYVYILMTDAQFASNRDEVQQHNMNLKHTTH